MNENSMANPMARNTDLHDEGLNGDNNSGITIDGKTLRELQPKLGLVKMADGSLLIADMFNNRIRRVRYARVTPERARAAPANAAAPRDSVFKRAPDPPRAATSDPETRHRFRTHAVRGP